MKRLLQLLTVILLLVTATSFKTLNSDWGDWTTISTSYDGIEGRVKKGDYNEYAHKYTWYFQFRNRYQKTVSFNYGYTPKNESSNCNPNKRKTLDSGETSDVTSDLLNENYKVHICIGDVDFGN